MCLDVCALASSVLLFMLRAMTHVTARAKRQTWHKLQDHLLGWRAGQREVAPSDIHLDSDSLSSLYEQKVAVCRFGGNSVWCICPPTIPKGSANLPSLAASSKHCYLEWCISLCLLAGVDSSSPTQTHIHGVKTHMMANANRHTNTNLHKHQWH